jgi:quercetin dioxygenase-like cupin family protein
MKIMFDQMNDTVLEHFNGGQGEFVAKMFNDGKCKILRGLLKPGCSIGMHTHVTSSEVIYVLSGEGKMYMADGVETLTAGDCHYCPQGQSHSFVNESNADLTFFAVVPEHGGN